MIFCYGAQIMSQICISLNPYVFGKFVDTLQNFTPDKIWDVGYWLGVGILILILFWGFHGPARINERYVALKIQQSFIGRFYKKATHLPLKWHQDHHSGNLITNANRAAQTLYRFSNDQFIYVQTLVKFLISISFLLWISMPLGILSLLSCILAVTIVVLFDKKIVPLYDSQNEIDNKIGATLYDYIGNMTTIITLRLNKLTSNNLIQRMQSIWPLFRQEVVLNEVKWFSVGILLSVIQSVILIGYIGYNLHHNGVVMIGLVVMLFRYQGELHDVFYSLSTLYSDLVRMDRDLACINPILNDMNKQLIVTYNEFPVSWNTIHISHLEFSHAVERQKIFKKIKFSIKKGENIALIGASGSGKSTLLNILGGLYDAQVIKYTVDNNWSVGSISSITTLIPQDPEIFDNTLLYNVALDLDISKHDIDRAVTLAEFSSTVVELPKGLETDIGEKGLNFSVGQKQRLALARGLFAARDSSLILMDEPTSSVDLCTEKEIITNILQEFTDACIIVSIHRLHLLPKFDRVIMLQQGEIIADGPVRELLSSDGPVLSLWKSYHNFAIKEENLSV